jgi:hypothetical protein
MPEVPTSALIQAAREVVTLLNAAQAGTFSIAFTAVRKYVPVYELPAGLTDLQVTVVPGSSEDTFSGRSSSDEEINLDVAIQKRLSNPESLDELDALMLIPQQVKHYLRGDDAQGDSRRKLPCGAHLMKATARLIYSPEEIKQLQAFTCIVALTYSKSGGFR